MEILTPRLRMVPFEPAHTQAHYEGLVAWPEVGQWLPSRRAGSLEDARRVTDFFVEHWARYGYGVWALLRREDGAFVGRCGLRWLDEMGAAELLYAISPTMWARGYATEAARASVTYARDALGMPNLVALVLPDNLASRQVLTRCGMSLVGPVSAFGMDMLKYHLDLTAPADQDPQSSQGALSSIHAASTRSCQGGGGG